MITINKQDTFKPLVVFPRGKAYRQEKHYIVAAFQISPFRPMPREDPKPAVALLAHAPHTKPLLRLGVQAARPAEWAGLVPTNAHLVLSTDSRGRSPFPN